MNTKTKLAVALILLMLPIYTFAQQSRFIELTVTDTITLKPISYTYQIDIGEKNDFMGMDIMMDFEEEDLPTTSIPQITKALDKEGFQYSLSSDKDYTVSSKTKNPSLLVPLTNENELKVLIDILKKLDGITGKIKEVKYESEAKFQDESFKRLYNKALAQATMMSKVSGESIGQLLSISDNAGASSFNFMDYYKQMLVEMPGGMFGKTEISDKKIEVKKTFKFALK